MMHHILLAALLLVSAIAIAQNSSEDGGNNSNLISRCGATNPSEDVLAATESMVKESAEAAGRQLEVNTYFHVVESEDNEGYVTQAMLDDQVCNFCNGQMIWQYSGVLRKLSITVDQYALLSG